MSGSSLEDALSEHGVQVSVKYGWSELDSTGRWSRPQQGFNKPRYFIPDDPSEPNRDGFGVRTSKLKVRGHGQSFSARFESEEGKDFVLLGWAVPITMEDKA